jgi:hypothetical protein
MLIADAPVKMWGMDSFSGRPGADTGKRKRINFETAGMNSNGAHFSVSPKMSLTWEEVLPRTSLRLR